MISGLAKNGIPAHSLGVRVQLQHDSQVLQWILLQDSAMNLLAWCSEGSLDFWAFQDSAKVGVHHLVHGQAGGKEERSPKSHSLTEHKAVQILI